MIFCFFENVDSTFQFQFRICSGQNFESQKNIFLLTLTSFSQHTQSLSGLSNTRITHSDNFATMLHASHSCKKIVRQISGIHCTSTVNEGDFNFCWSSTTGQRAASAARTAICLNGRNESMPTTEPVSQAQAEAQDRKA